MRPLKWWLLLPGMAFARLTYCRRHGHERYDGWQWCMTCGEPWFRSLT